jgi:hypothetical protein
MLPTKFRFIWPSGFRGEDLKKLANQKQELPVVAMFVNRSGQNELQLMQNISSNNKTPSYKGHLSIVVILSNSPS